MKDRFRIFQEVRPISHTLALIYSKFEIQDSPVNDLAGDQIEDGISVPKSLKWIARLLLHPPAHFEPSRQGRGLANKMSRHSCPKRHACPPYSSSVYFSNAHSRCPPRLRVNLAASETRRLLRYC